MHVTVTGTGAVHQAPFPDGPAIEVLLEDPGPQGRLSAAHVIIPPGGGIPEHTHGESVALVIPLSGTLDILSGHHRHTLLPGRVVLVDVEEPVRLRNTTEKPVTLLAVFAPASFIHTLSSWPQQQVHTFAGAARATVAGAELESWRGE